MYQYSTRNTHGFSLVELIIVAALSVVVFLALFSSVKYILQVISLSQSKLSALSVANERMEYFRSLPYDEVGVVAGYPTGTVPQTSTTSLNGITFYERVRVDYVDDPADGLLTADDNGIILDYKQIRLEYEWRINEATSSLQLVSNIVPRSIETTAGGGTVRINVLDDQAVLLPDASVRLISSSSTFNYDVTNTTDANGAALFNVPADSGYQVEVTANISGKQYSIDKTYEATTTLPNPAVAPFAVLESDISTLTFQIGELSDLDIQAFTSVTEASVVETFSDLSGAPVNTNVAANGVLQLFDTAGVYETTGSAYLSEITPGPLLRWETVRVAATVPVNTSYQVQFFTGSGPYVLVPDSDLPGNAAGFFDSLIDLSGLDVTTYPALTVGLTLTTTDTSITPQIDEVSVWYRVSETPAAGVGYTMRGQKSIGTDAGLQPVYKVSTSSTLDAGGADTYTDLEFDSYTFDFSSTGFDIASACSAEPFQHRAGIDESLELVLAPATANTLRVTVTDVSGRPIPGAAVRLSRPGYNTTVTTNTCGQAYFSGGGLSANADFDLDVTATGYTAHNTNPFGVAGDTVTTITLNE